MLHMNMANAVYMWETSGPSKIPADHARYLVKSKRTMYASVVFYSSRTVASVV